MQLGLFWEDLRKGMYAPQGETGFVNNVRTTTIEIYTKQEFPKNKRKHINGKKC